MPTKYKPQLYHVGFDWFNQSNQFQLELLAVETDILEKSGFEREYGYSRSKPAYDEARELIKENNLAGGGDQDGCRVQGAQ